MERLELDKMHWQIELWERTLSDDGYGNQKETWQKEKSLWAEVGRTDRYSEQKLSEGVRAENILKFKVYFDSAITFEKKIKHDGKMYNIMNILELGYRDGMEITGRWTA